MSETSWGRRRYRTTNWKAYNAALNAKGDLTIWLDKDIKWLAPPSGKRGRSKTFSDAAIQSCLTITYLTYPCGKHWTWYKRYCVWLGTLGAPRLQHGVPQAKKSGSSGALTPKSQQLVHAR